MMPPASLRAFACGVTGSGKTTVLRELFINRSPRVLLLDQTGEWGEPDALDLGQLRRKLHQVVGAASWRVVASLDTEELPALAALLNPGGGRASFALAVGGMALAVDEVDLIAGRSAAPAVSALWRRGRHVGLSIFAGSQRPADVHRSVTSQSQWLAVCRVHEPRDLAYLREILPAEAMDALDALPPFGALLWETARRSGYIVDAERRVVRLVGEPGPRPGDLLHLTPAARRRELHRA